MFERDIQIKEKDIFLAKTHKFVLSILNYQMIISGVKNLIAEPIKIRWTICVIHELHITKNHMHLSLPKIYKYSNIIIYPYICFEYVRKIGGK